jgi:hypothetical protein
LAELLETLYQTYDVPRSATDQSAIWREVQLIHAKAIVAKPERLVSNWLAIDQLPQKLRNFDFKGGPERLAKARMQDAPWPLVPFRRGFLTFAHHHDLQEHFGASLPLKLEAEKETDRFLEDGWESLDIARWDARNKFSDLARQALEALFQSKRLKGYQLSGWQQAWWAPIDVAPTTKVSFRWDDLAGLRQIQGHSAKRQMYWHFGISVAARTAPLRHVRVLSRLIFTEDGHKPFDDPAKMHRLRRSFAKTWRNARWRDMLLAFLHWLAEGSSSLTAPVSSDDALVLKLPPLSWVAPVSIPTDSEAAEDDEDDPSDDNEIYGYDTEEGAAGEAETGDEEP